jgi:hypothetical protein
MRLRDDGAADDMVGAAMMLEPALAGGGVRFENGKGDLHQAASRQWMRADGRGTPSGHRALAGQFTENQAMMESYFRAVKDAPLSMRSKNRQSPAASRETVAPFMFLAAPKAAAQANK